MDNSLSRRRFLAHGITGLSSAWIAAHWPAVLAAADHAHRAAQSATPPKFEFFSPEQATEIDAIAARIIPTDDMPGAREAGVVYFIDRALTTFASDDQKTYKEGLPELQARVRELFPAVERFSAATPEQQDEVLHSLDEHSAAPARPFRPRPDGQNFFEILRQHTIAGFLIDPDVGGNRGGVGWKVIGREREHIFQPPFGYYDKDYPGWQPVSKDADKK
ncbi:MAG TPA: gluconate 2-dehydrogenase subunit 3 family protein [Candidatus Acidoferrum sp.]|nr:gluconate 2-dehydrogenase subunit 3 family protein [Candidatus Acidoferrum sp.]